MDGWKYEGEERTWGKVNGGLKEEKENPKENQEEKEEEEDEGSSFY